MSTNDTTTEALAIAAAIGTPTILWGPPGSGKTSVVRALAELWALHLEVVVASIHDPTDFSGLPVVTDGGVSLAPPAWARRLADVGSGLLFLDELTTAPPAVQAALLRVVPKHNRSAMECMRHLKPASFLRQPDTSPRLCHPP